MNYSQILEKILFFTVMLIPFFISAILHELGHGYMAYRLGDNTAKESGRLSINPLKHIDPIGTFVFPVILYLTVGFPLVMFKPVPINPANLKNPDKDNIKVALAGPAANLLLIILITILYYFLNSFEGIQNSRLPRWVIKNGAQFFVIINFVIIIFNLLPIPPLDGSWVLKGFIPVRWRYYYQKGYTYFIIIFIILFLTGTINHILNPAISFLIKFSSYLIR